MKDVRQAVSRIERRGYTVRAVRHNTLTPADFEALEAAASLWRGDGGEERGFSMALGRLGDPLDGDCVLVAAYDGDDRVRGFLSFVPWGRNGLSLDLMRRDPTAENGLIEFLVAGLGPSGRRPGRVAGLAELRDVPRGVRARRVPRRRADRPHVAPGAHGRQLQLAAREPVPLERQVLPGLAAALHLLRVLLGPAARGDRRGQRRGVPLQALDGDWPCAAARRRARVAGSLQRGLRRRGGRPDPRRGGPARGGAVAWTGCRSRSGSAARSSSGSGRWGSTPTR